MYNEIDESTIYKLIDENNILKEKIDELKYEITNIQNELSNKSNITMVDDFYKLLNIRNKLLIEELFPIHPLEINIDCNDIENSTYLEEGDVPSSAIIIRKLLYKFINYIPDKEFIKCLNDPNDILYLLIISSTNSDKNSDKLKTCLSFLDDSKKEMAESIIELNSIKI